MATIRKTVNSDDSIMCIAGATGPTALFVAGNHGDEHEGQVVLAELCRTLDSASLRGRVIIMPAANYPAPVTDYYRAQGLLNIVDGLQPIDVVTEELGAAPAALPSHQIRSDVR